MNNTSILKFGGQTIANTASINKISLQIIDAVKKGKRPVVVVSAMGKETDNLIELAAKLDGCGYHRELDQLLCTGEIKAASLMAMALINNGLKAISINFTKIGIYTDENHSNSKILKVETDYIKKLLSENIVPVVAGFQGLNRNKDVCTLGRGGSDITAIVLAASLEAQECILFKDVGAIYDNDPKINANSKALEFLTYKELKEIVNKGSRVVNSEAVSYAETNKIKICIANPETFIIGTTITN